MKAKANPFVPDAQDIGWMERDLAEHGPFPVFSEGHLYPRLGKEDARFVLAVVEEYEALIKKLGPDAVRELLES